MMPNDEDEQARVGRSLLLPYLNAQAMLILFPRSTASPVQNDHG